jgi:hypothetical protein
MNSKQIPLDFDPNLIPKYLDNLRQRAEAKLLPDKISKKIYEKINKSHKKKDELTKLFSPESLKPWYEIITDHNILDKLTNLSLANIVSSDFIILKGLFNNIPCYIKIFYLNEGLDYEQEIYNYFKNKDEKIKSYYENFFVKMLATLYINAELCQLKLTGIKELTDYLNKYPLNNNVFLVITENIGGTTYADFLVDIFNKNNEDIFNKNNEDTLINILINTLFDIFYIVYLMNFKFELMHNDCNFANILIKKLDIPEKRKYIINNIIYERNINYKICFNEFSNSYLHGFMNQSLKIRDLKQNIMSSKDIWTILSNLIIVILEFNQNFNKNNKLILDFIINNKNIYPSDEVYEDFIKYETLLYFIKKLIQYNLKQSDDIYKSYMYDNIMAYINNDNSKTWDAFCRKNVQANCIIPYNVSFNAKTIFNNFISEYYPKFNLNIIDPFYKKYIKYKNKYLKLKKYNVTK